MNSKKNKTNPDGGSLGTFRSQAEARLVEFVNSDLLDNLIEELSYLNSSILVFFDIKKRFKSFISTFDVET